MSRANTFSFMITGIAVKNWLLLEGQIHHQKEEEGLVPGKHWLAAMDSSF